MMQGSYVFMLLLFCIAPFQGSAHASDLSEAWKKSLNGVFVQPSFKQVQQAQHLFEQTLDGQHVDAQAWSELGMQLAYVQYKKNTFLMIREQEHQQLGRGFFVIRQQGTASQLLIQAPHSFKDLHTGRIALKLFMAGDAKAAAWNTVPRFYTVSSQKVDADMAHRGGTFFLAFSKAFALHYPEGKTLQLHGFAKAKRHSEQGRQADIILSSGSKKLNSSVQAFARCLKQQVSPQVLLYPTQVSELGGTRNVLARALRYQSSHHFIHMEMSFEVRDLLRKNKKLRHGLLQCL